MQKECHHFLQKKENILPNTKQCEECEKAASAYSSYSNVFDMWACRLL